LQNLKSVWPTLVADAARPRSPLLLDQSPDNTRPDGPLDELG
jgi:hypothetical protein